MIPALALTFTLSVIATLYWAVRNPQVRLSNALWIPVVWLAVGSSRPLSAWFKGSIQQGGSVEDGSPFDRTFLTILIALGLTVVVRRGARTLSILRANPAICLFLLYCLLSVFWADLAFVTFKRWMRAAGDLVMLMVIVTEPEAEAGFKWVLDRIGILHIPLSVVIIRYFPAYGRSYSIAGNQMWTGVGDDKNALGAICMIFGSALLWRMLPGNSEDEPRRVRKLGRWARSLVFVLTGYLMWVIDSKTALVCFFIALFLVVLPRMARVFRGTAMVTTMAAGIISVTYAILFLGIGSSAIETLGRDSSLTGRTGIWEVVLRLATNPWLGTGYESFWVGERFDTVARELGPLNQAHNGYLEIYLNLGWTGILLLAAIGITGYRNMMKTLRENVEVGTLKVAFFTVALVYNFTEATFKMMSPIWIMFLWASLSIPAPRRSKRRSPVYQPEEQILSLDKAEIAGPA